MEEEQNNKTKKHRDESDAFTRRMFIKGMATTFAALPVFAWPRWAQAFYYNLSFFGKGQNSSLYVEDIFSSYLYVGNSPSSNGIINGIDLLGKGGLVWIKNRTGPRINQLYDTARGVSRVISTNNTNAEVYIAAKDLGLFFNNGFELEVDGASNPNSAGESYVSWTFRKAAKFFDVVTYTGDGAATKQITHSLGQAPGMIFIKKTGTTSNWGTWHRSLTANHILYLNTTAASVADGFNPNPTATEFTAQLSPGDGYNGNGVTYVAYLFAHDTSANGLIQCGSFTTDGAAKAAITLGWEAQYVMIKRTDGVANWIVLDQLRGYSLSNYASLLPNSDAAEANSNGGEDLTATATGFKVSAITSANSSYIYMAIRRGPMKVPTDATKIFTPIAYNQAVNTALTVGFPADMAMHSLRTLGNAGWIEDRLRGFASANSAGASKVLDTNSTAAESNWTVNNPAFYSFNNTQVLLGSNGGGNPSVAYFFRRAPGFFDQVCYTGNQQTGPITVSHNLGSTPELLIIKKRNNTGDWIVRHKDFGDNLKFIRFNTTGGVNAGSTGYWNNAAPTATTFTVGTDGDVNGGGAADTFVAYLFASCPGVSKVGNFTGSASDVTVSCGFSGQPRFVLVKRTDSTGDWIVVDSSRGTSAYLTLNTTNNEVAATVITFTTGGFVAKAGTVANAASGASYIFMAIA